MVFITFSVYGPEFAARTFVPEHGIGEATTWARGDRLRTGRERQDSGFMISLPDADTTAEAIPAVASFLTKSHQWLSALPSSAAQREFHLGMTVGENKSFAPRLELPVSFLASLVASGIQLDVSGYPTSDET